MKTPLTAIIITVLMVLNTLSQNITNTIGFNGVFKIKDGVTDFFTLNQLDGSIILNLGQPGNLRGSILKGSTQFLHTYSGSGTSGANTFLGLKAGNFNIGGLGSEGSFNTGVGFESLNSLTTGSNNSAFGNSTLFKNTTGSFNSAVGYGALLNNTIGIHNSAFGAGSLFLNSTGWHNTAVGYDALSNNVSGWQNTAVGHHSLRNNTGNYNTAIGYNSGSTVTSGSNLTLIGIDANPTSPTAVDQITLGNQFVSSLRCNVTTITSLSDRRDKGNIIELSLGLDFIAKLKPRQFNWDRREWYENGVSDGSKMKELPSAGFIAQELDSAQTEAGAEWLNLVLKDNPEKWEATPGNLLPVMVKAIQELNEKFELLKAENLSLKSENDNLKNKLTSIEQNQFILLEKIKQINDQQLKQVQHDDNSEIKITEK